MEIGKCTRLVDKPHTEASMTKVAGGGNGPALYPTSVACTSQGMLPPKPRTSDPAGGSFQQVCVSLRCAPRSRAGWEPVEVTGAVERCL